MIPGAVKWCNICNARPADGVLEMLSKSTNELVPYDACQECVRKIVDNKIDWIENNINGKVS